MDISDLKKQMGVRALNHFSSYQPFLEYLKTSISDPKANKNMHRGYFEKTSFVYRNKSMNYNESCESWGWALISVFVSMVFSFLYRFLIGS